MAVTFATETNARQGFSVANVSMRRGRLDFVASTKALPHEQNEQVRALMRKILAEEFGGTVTHAAKALGISHSIIHEMLSGSRGAGTKVLRALSEHPGRSIDDILHGVERERGPRGNRGALAVVSLLLNEALDPAVTVAKVCL